MPRYQSFGGVPRLPYQFPDLTPDEIEMCRGFGVESELGGPSNVRQAEERAELLGDDQFIMQVGEYVGCRAVLGDEAGRLEYVAAREAHRADVWKGDGGSDMLSIENVDFKGSRWSLERQPKDHHLLVRPKEYHEGTVYVLILVWVREGESPAVRPMVQGWTRLDQSHWTDKPMPNIRATGPRHQMRGENLSFSLAAPLRRRDA